MYIDDLETIQPENINLPHDDEVNLSRANKNSFFSTLDNIDLNSRPAKPKEPQAGPSSRQ